MTLKTFLHTQFYSRYIIYFSFFFFIGCLFLFYGIYETHRVLEETARQVLQNASEYELGLYIKEIHAATVKFTILYMADSRY